MFKQGAEKMLQFKYFIIFAKETGCKNDRGPKTFPIVETLCIRYQIWSKCMSEMSLADSKSLLLYSN